MNYLHDKQLQKKKFSNVIIFVLVLSVLFYFRMNVFSGLAYVSHMVFRPVLVLGNNVGERFSSLGSFFVSKNSLYLENKDLRSQLNEYQMTLTNYDSILNENVELKEMFQRNTDDVVTTLASILSKPNKSPYDTLVIDVGVNKGVTEGDMVFALGYSPRGEALGSVPIGRVSNVYQNSSKVILFTSSGEKMQVIVSFNPSSETPLLNNPIVNESENVTEEDSPSAVESARLPRKDIFLEVVGRGGGNFEMTLPRDFAITQGDHAVLPGILPYTLGMVETIISDPRDSFTKALLTSPVNIQEIKFVLVIREK